MSQLPLTLVFPFHQQRWHGALSSGKVPGAVAAVKLCAKTSQLE